MGDAWALAVSVGVVGAVAGCLKPHAAGGSRTGDPSSRLLTEAMQAWGLDGRAEAHARGDDSRHGVLLCPCRRYSGGRCAAALGAAATALCLLHPRVSLCATVPVTGVGSAAVPR